MDPQQQMYIAPGALELFSRYLECASGYWRGTRAWMLFGFLVSLILFQLLVQYLINFWNRDFFNALDNRDVELLWHEARMFLPLALSSILIAILTVWAKMTVQRNWREWLSKSLIEYWLRDNHYRQLKIMKNKQLNSEYRIAEDARVATDIPIDLILGLLTSILTGFAFITILWEVGGTLKVNVGGYLIGIPGYLVISAILYSLTLTTAMLFVGRNLTGAVEGKNHSEAEFRAAASRLREHGEDLVHLVREKEEAMAVETTFDQVIEWWRKMCWQLMRTTFIAHGNGLIAPIIGLLLCTPQYLAREMSLGQVVQAAAAFVTVQGCFNWFMDNYPRIADWRSSANRVAFLLLALDELSQNKK